jgi:hypothetical protein
MIGAPKMQSRKYVFGRRDTLNPVSAHRSGYPESRRSPQTTAGRTPSTDKTACETKANASERGRTIACCRKKSPIAVFGQPWLEVERTMGIENTTGALGPVEIMKLQARRELRAIFV